MKTKLKQEIGKRIHVLRTQRGQSMDAFAEMIDSTSATVSNIENGKSIPGGALLLNLSNACDVSTDWILKGEREKDRLHENAGKHIFFKNKWLIYSRLNNGYMGDEELQTIDAVFSLLESIQHLKGQDIELLSKVAFKMRN